MARGGGPMTTTSPAVDFPPVALERGALADGVPAGTTHTRREATPHSRAAGVGAVDADAAQARLLASPLIARFRRAEWLADPDEDDGDAFSEDRDYLP